MNYALLESWEITTNKAFLANIITIGSKGLPERHAAWVNDLALRNAIKAVKGREMYYYNRRETFVYGYYVEYSIKQTGAYVVDRLLPESELPEPVPFAVSMVNPSEPDKSDKAPSDEPCEESSEELTRRSRLSPQISVGHGTITVNTTACELINDSDMAFVYASLLTDGDNVLIRFSKEHQESATKISRRTNAKGELLPGLQIRNAGLIQKVFRKIQSRTDGPVKHYFVELDANDCSTLKVIRDN